MKDIATHAVYGPQVQECINPGCEVKLIGALGLRDAPSIEVEPHRDGTILLRDTGNLLPLAVQTTVAQRFGRQGTLHRKHDCPKVRKRR